MKIVFKRCKTKEFLIILILTTLFFSFINQTIHNYLFNQIEENNNHREMESLLLAQDTTAPIISFLQPSHPTSFLHHENL